MRTLLTLALIFLFASCKKTSMSKPEGYQYTDTSHISEQIQFRVDVVKQSAYDSAHHISFDTVNINYSRIVGEPYDLENRNAVLLLEPSFAISFGNLGGTSNNGDFIISHGFFPNFKDVHLNTPYENTYEGPFEFCPIFIRCHGGAGPASARYFLSQDIYPSDGTTEAIAKAYCKIIVTKKYEVHWKAAVFTILDGTFSGYYEGYFGKYDPSKYKQRLEFSCTFHGLKVSS